MNQNLKVVLFNLIDINTTTNHASFISNRLVITDSQTSIVIPMDSIQSLTVWFLEDPCQGRMNLKEQKIYEA